MPLVERRYAEALLDLAHNPGEISAYRDEMGAAVSVYETSTDLKRLLLSAVTDSQIKKDVLRRVFGTNSSWLFLNFLLLLVDKGRINYLPGIGREFNRLADERLHILSIEIFSAAPLDDSQVSGLKEKYRERYRAASVRAKVIIDRNILGGIQVKIGDRVVDSTVRSRLEGLAKSIVEG